jgi:phosphoribosylformylglycinamidine cyclo-ligase
MAKAEDNEGRRDPNAAAGVDYGVIDPGKRLALDAALSTASCLVGRGLSEVDASRGESAYVVDVGDFYISTVTEGLGTKNRVADAVRPLTGRTHYEAVAKDTVATILNDLATAGGVPMSLTAYWAVGSSDWFADDVRMRDLVHGWGKACAEAEVSWGGGETQSLSGLIDPSALVLAGSAVGLIRPRGRLLLGDQIEPGDAILFAPSVGIHANGLTLARQVVESLPKGYATLVPGDPNGRGVGEVLLDPAPMYGLCVEALQEAEVPLHYAVHVTGHGWRKLMRAQRELTYVIERLPPVPPVLQFLKDAARLSDAEAYSTFNMGAGFVFFVPSAQVEAAQKAARLAGFELLQAGTVENGPKQVVLRPLNLTFQGKSLNIR